MWRRPDDDRSPRGSTDALGFDRAAWHVDQTVGEITFTPPGLRVTAPVHVVGSYDPTDGTWLCGWDHPSVPEPLAGAGSTQDT
ncbi:hypothetical protein OMK64_14830 [Cellulomonas fimi]|uniref:DUF6882 domain-containing protein n=1 Tax=Cellulomonas fimi TaxID=1708 RepID=UPI00234DFD0E|nr:DUF6882 domain-containing protein [Cellulomonas fimi]MDC7122808.1 hypothetical protein [Cellulomonas fimi]